MDYAKVLPATGAGLIIGGALGYWSVALILAGLVIVGALLLRKFAPIKK